MTQTPTLTGGDLCQFIGSESLYRYPLFRGYAYTEGVQYVAEKGSAYWLIEAIFSHQVNRRIRLDARLQAFQLWKLTVQEGRGLLVCEDGDGKRILHQAFNTDFSLPEIKLYLCDGVLMLPSEY